MHLGEVQRVLQRVDETNTVAVMPGGVQLLKKVGSQLGLTMPLLSDPSWDLHHRYGMRRGSTRDVFLSLSTWLAYARLMRQWNTTRPSEDVMQLGGTAVVDADGILQWIHRSQNPADQADPATIGQAVRNL